MSEPSAPWASSPAIDLIVPDLVAALHAATDVVKGRTARVPTNSGGEYTYRYADLAGVLEQIRPHLIAHGLAVTQVTEGAGKDVAVRTVFVHTSGQWIAYPPLGVPTGQVTPQAVGSAITYARRYSLLAALGIATEDDDGQRAAQPPPPEPEHPNAQRARTAFDELVALDDAGRDAMRAWAGQRRLTVPAMLASETWLAHVEQWLDERRATEAKP
jgi:hypothetical protein